MLKFNDSSAARRRCFSCVGSSWSVSYYLCCSCSSSRGVRSAVCSCHLSQSCICLNLALSPIKVHSSPKHPRNALVVILSPFRTGCRILSLDTLGVLVSPVLAMEIKARNLSGNALTIPSIAFGSRTSQSKLLHSGRRKIRERPIPQRSPASYVILGGLSSITPTRNSRS
jgi:hypothetical protein